MRIKSTSIFDVSVSLLQFLPKDVLSGTIATKTNVCVTRGTMWLLLHVFTLDQRVFLSDWVRQAPPLDYEVSFSKLLSVNVSAGCFLLGRASFGEASLFAVEPCDTAAK